MADKQPRRRWSDEEKTSIVAQTKVGGVSVAQVAQRYAVNANQVHQWIRNPKFNSDLSQDSTEVFLPVELANSSKATEVIDHKPLPGCDCDAPFHISITTLQGLRLDIDDCRNVDLICQLVRGLQ